MADNRSAGFQFEQPNPLLSLGSTALGGLFEGLGGLFGGKSPGEKRRQSAFDLLRGRLDQPLINQNQLQQFIPGLQASLQPQLQGIANRASQRVGIGSGVGQGELARQAQGGLQSLFGNLQQQALFTNVRGKLQRENTLASLAR